MKYEMDNATMGRDTRAVKATEDPMLMSESSTQIPATNMSAGMGDCMVGWT